MNIEKQPLHFCILIPCYNNFEGLIASLKTVVYAPTCFFTLIIDDGRQMPINIATVRSALGPDHRVTVLRNEENKGITYSLNKGLEWIQKNMEVDYIARLDCSDLCTNDRFYKQVSYLNKHPETGLLGTWCTFANETFKYHYKTPVLHDKIARSMYFRNVFIHPTVMFRTSLLKRTGDYPYNFPYAEDYAFFWEFVKNSSTCILDEYLVTCDINSTGISLKNRQRQLQSRLRVIRHYGTNPVFTVFGIIKVCALRLVPKRLVLQLKSRKLSNKR